MKPNYPEHLDIASKNAILELLLVVYKLRFGYPEHIYYYSMPVM